MSGIVVSPHPAATDAGLEILKGGGNAIDAAVTAAFTEAVVEPAHNGIGAYGGCLVAYSSKTHSVTAVDYNTRAPTAATDGMFSVEFFKDGRGYTVPDCANLYGHRSVGIPAVPSGLDLFLKRYGTITLSEALKPSIRAAQQGFIVNAATSEAISQVASILRAKFSNTRRVLLPNGSVPEHGETLRFPQLAKTLERMAEFGVDDFYKGDIARRIVKCVRAGGGILSEEDLENYEAVEVQPLRIRYSDYEIYAPPLCSGGLTTLQILKVLENFSVSRFHNASPKLFHLLIEVMKVSWKRRLEMYGDPDFVNVDQTSELGDANVEEMVTEVKRGLVKPRIGSVISPEPLNCTSHICVVDSEENWVSVTQTHGGYAGSLVTEPNTGIILGHGLGRFDPRSGRPNSIAPSKRPLHNMSPVIVLRQGRPIIATGSSGGRTIVNNIAYFVLNLLDLGLTPEETLEAPRCHIETKEPVQLEWTAGESTFETLRKAGHRMTKVFRVGGPAHIIMQKKGRTVAATDPRTEGQVGRA